MSLLGGFLMIVGCGLFFFTSLEYSPGGPVTAEIVVRPILAMSYIIGGAILMVSK